MSDRVLVATRKGLLTVARNSGGWSIAHVDFLGDNVSMVMADARDGRLYAGLDHGHFGVKMHRAPGLGGTWEECSVPTYPKQPEGEVELDNWGKPMPWNTALIWSLAPGGADQPGLLWCGTIPGGLFRSTDGATTWEIVRPLWDDPKRKEWLGGGADLPGIHSICVDPRDSQCVRVGISCGGVWETKDGGDTWACRAQGMWAAYMPPDKASDPNIQDPHCLAQSLGQPDKLWVQHHNGVFRSTDASASWAEVKDVPPSVFGFAVAVHPEDGDTAWLVPAVKDECRVPVDGALVVTRTRDGGQSFEVLRKGLPQSHAYDVVFRHGLDIDATGERLAIGTSTGGLWISEDQGDSWACVSQTLPPVYAVRFASA